ncbi:thioesterase [Bdellovibrio sp. qaytius]|nr:thioesterase [Bdellovibrio sp. qaytius]
MVNLESIQLDLPPFVPILKIETAHSQTILGHVIKSKDFTETGRQMFLTLPDGDQMSLKIYENKSANKKNTVVTLFHGLAGDHTSDYIQRSAVLAFDLGYSVVTVDHRGAGLAEGLAKKPYHSGRGEDASEVSLKLRAIFPEMKQIFIGFSLSGSVVLNLVTGRYGQYLPDYAVVVNAPINLQTASDHLIKGFSRIYDLRFYFMLRKLIQKFEPDFNLPIVSNTRLIDDMFTSIKSGFVDASDYYAQCSTFKYLDKISVPTFVLTSKDDPFIAFADYQKASWNTMTHRTFIDHGGHMGYISKHNTTQYGRRWLDAYLHQVLLAIESTAYTPKSKSI